LLRGHVGDGADDASLPCERPRHTSGRVKLHRIVLQFRQAEVEHFQPAVLRDHHVRRLQIPMRDPLRVRGHQRVGEGDPVFQQRLERQAARRNQVGERRSVDELHREKHLAVDVIDRVNGDDVRVIERGDRPGFTLEAVERVGIRFEARGQHFEGDVALQPRVTRTIHLAHSAGTHRGENLVEADAVVRRQRHLASGLSSAGP
jgi:hypothetical protein